MERRTVISLRASDRRQELDRDAVPAVAEKLDSNNLGEVFTVAAVTREMTGECHQQAHAFLVVLPVCEEVESFARDITRGSDFFEKLTT
jgi:hypothetical protein